MKSFSSSQHFFFTIVVVLQLLVYTTVCSSNKVPVSFERKVGTTLGVQNFYWSQDYFKSIGRNKQDRQQFCLSLNATCDGHTINCEKCYCKNITETFISYYYGCRQDFFKGISCVCFLSFFILLFFFFFRARFFQF